MKYINLTPHTINVFDPEGRKEVLKAEPSGLVARIEVERTIIKSMGGVTFYESKVTGKPYCKDKEGNLKPFPNEIDNTYYIVSGMFHNHFTRADVVHPGELVRDSNGKPIGCKGLSL